MQINLLIALNTNNKVVFIFVLQIDAADYRMP